MTKTANELFDRTEPKNERIKQLEWEVEKLNKSGDAPQSNTDEIAKALCVFQSEVMSAPAKSDNPFYKSHYADLTSIWQTIQAPLTDNGLSVTQTMSPSEKGFNLITTLHHTSGQSIVSTIPVTLKDPMNPQAAGSAITYYRRYCLAAILGITQRDDDGNAGSPISKEDADYLHRLVKSRGVSNEAASSVLREFNYNRSNEILVRDYEAIVKKIESL